MLAAGQIGAAPPAGPPGSAGHPARTLQVPQGSGPPPWLVMLRLALFVLLLLQLLLPLRLRLLWLRLQLLRERHKLRGRRRARDVSNSWCHRARKL